MGILKLGLKMFKVRKLRLNKGGYDQKKNQHSQPLA